MGRARAVITSYSIHYTKLYDYPILLFTFIFLSDIFFEDNFLLYILCVVVFIILVTTIRYFILPKDIEKHLTLIEKGE